MAFIQLTRNKTCIVDDEDVSRLSIRKWYAIKPRGDTWYAKAKMGGKHIAMHTFIMKTKKPFVVDHVDGDGLNNQKSNLRICLQHQNMWNQKKRSTNKSGFKGVFLHKKSKRWCARINCKKGIYLGLFKDKYMAAKAYDIAAQIFHGRFAVTNQMLGLLK